MATVDRLNSPTNEELLSVSENGKDSPQKDRIQMKRELGVLDGVGVIIGIIVGAGIFLSPKGVLLYAGSPGFALIVWILSGILATIGALCYAELGTMIPKSGGDYAYLNEAFGPLLAFLYMWSAFIVIMPTGNAVTAITFAQYLLQPFWMECHPPLEVVRLLAAVIIFFITMINCYDVKWVTKITDLFSLGKVLALFVIVLFGFIAFFRGDTTNLHQPMAGSNFHASAISLSFYSGLFSFAGWNYLNFVTEEIKDPYKNLPRAICISLPSVTIIYVLVNFAYFVVLSQEELLSSDAVAVTFGAKTLGYFKFIMSLFVAGCTFGSLNSNIFAASRLFFVGAQNGHLPQAISLIHINKFTPIPSLISMGILSIVLVVVDDVYSLINYTTFVESLFTLFSVAGLVWLRYKKPELKRPIKVNIVLPLLFFIIFAFLCTMPFFQEPVAVGIGFIIILTGIPVYMMFVSFGENFPTVRNLSRITKDMKIVKIRLMRFYKNRDDILNMGVILLSRLSST
ncbi:hypothetical protein V9T40_001235 [Parthenolecanium corni]|uniref:Amino acid permease n=1 Tax=Parthenolecanium corni TaxID=536013 RepID=A0AAN9TRZ2_9HEMI